MRDEKENVDKEGKERDEERREEQDQESKKVARRMGRSMEMGRGGHAKTDQGKECCNRMDNQNRRE